MKDNITLREFGDIIERYINNNLSSFPDNVKADIMGNIIGYCSYEEEGQKIKPNLLFGTNIKDYISKHDDFYSVVLCDKESSTKQAEYLGREMKSIIKSLMPICNHRWTIYISFNTETEDFSYGLMKDFTEFSEKSFVDLIFHQPDQKMLYLSAISPKKLYVQTSGEEGFLLHVGYKRQDNNENYASDTENSNENASPRNALKEFFEVCCKSNNIDEKRLERVCKRLAYRIYPQVHGTICVVIDHNKNVPNLEIFKDSKVLETPINLWESIEELATKMEGNYCNAMTYYSLIDLLITFMNLDGICIIDNTFCIRAINCFIKPKETATIGGARSRTFNALAEQMDKGILACYFQSQDGNTKCIKKSD